MFSPLAAGDNGPYSGFPNLGPAGRKAVPSWGESKDHGASPSPWSSFIATRSLMTSVWCSYFVCWCLQKCQWNRLFWQASTDFYLFNGQYYYHLFFSVRKQSPGLSCLSQEWVDPTVGKAFERKLLHDFCGKGDTQKPVVDLAVMEPEDFDSEDKEMLSWDINDTKLPQVCTYIRIRLLHLTWSLNLLNLEGNWRGSNLGRCVSRRASAGQPAKDFGEEMHDLEFERVLPIRHHPQPHNSYRLEQRKRYFPSLWEFGLAAHTPTLASW